MPASPTFELHGAGVRVADRYLVGPLDMVVAPGRLYGLLGHNGSGKSTLLKIMARQMPPSEGRLRFEGRPLEAWSARQLARRVAYLPQQLPVSTGLTVRELVRLGRYPWHGAIGRFTAADVSQVDEALRLTAVDSLADRFVDTLSGGERQRAWLAMLVAQDSACMLLDEPISALDVAHQIEVMDLVRRLCHERSLTVVTVLHDVNIAARFCDELIALHRGQAVAHGTPADVVQPDSLHRIYGVEMGVIQHPERGVPVSYVG
ncbi:MAG TPA: ATP-binding cassette domain-containing protein [Arenicellales bacterium]|nr:ATP-binding cassette domain-containing protein [Arenicellales bacterium]